MPEQVEVQRNKRTGEMRRRVAGGGWEPHQPPTPVASSEPDTWWGGFTRHLMEKEPAARNALLSGAALATGTAPAMLAAPLVGRGMGYLSKFLGTGENPLPASGQELGLDLAGDVAQGAIDAYGGSAIKQGVKGARMVTGAIADRIPSSVRSLLAAKSMASMNPAAIAGELALSKPGLDAIEHVGDTLTPAGFKRAAGSVMEGLTPGESAPSIEALTHDDLVADGARRFRAGKAQQVAAQKGSGLDSVRTPDRKLTITPYDAMNSAGQFSGDRTVRGIANLQKEAPGGLSSITPDEVARFRQPVAADDIFGGMDAPPAPAPASIDALMKAKGPTPDSVMRQNMVRQSEPWTDLTPNLDAAPPAAEEAPASIRALMNTTGKSDKLADVQSGSDKLGALFDAMDGEDWRPIGNGTYRPPK